MARVGRPRGADRVDEAARVRVLSHEDRPEPHGARLERGRLADGDDGWRRPDRTPSALASARAALGEATTTVSATHSSRRSSAESLLGAVA